MLAFALVAGSVWVVLGEFSLLLIYSAGERVRVEHRERNIVDHVAAVAAEGAGHYQSLSHSHHLVSRSFRASAAPHRRSHRYSINIPAELRE